MSADKKNNIVDILVARANRPLLYSMLCFFLLALANIGEPADNLLRYFSDNVRSAKPSGEIAIIFPDRFANSNGDSWSWSRDELADLAEHAHKQGARRIAITQIITAPGENDRLATALKKFPDKPILGINFTTHPETRERILSFPAKDLRDVGTLALTNQYFDPFGRVEEMLYAVQIDKQIYPSMSVALAEAKAKQGKMFSIDYAYASEKLPEITVKDLASGKVNLRNKTLVITTSQAGMNIAGYGRVPIGYSHYFAAETLKKGAPHNIGHLLPFILAIGACLAIWFGSRKTMFITSAAGIVTAVFAPIFLANIGIFCDPALAIAVIACVFVMRLWRSYKNSAARENALTGLPNLAAFREQKLPQNSSILVCRAVNYPSLVTIISKHEAELIKQIESRLELTGNVKLHHSDDGLFVWAANHNNVSELADQLDALQLLFSRAITVADCKMDVKVAFGVEISEDPSSASRLAKAIMAADIAASKGRKWHFFEEEEFNNAQNTISLMSELDSAIDEGQIWVALQPQYSVEDYQLCGFEALVRWEHRTRGLIPPIQFIEMAEANGRIDKLSYFVLDQALAALVDFRKTLPDLGVAVNLSTRMFDDPRLVSKIEDLLNKHGINGGSLTLEITETAQVGDEAIMIASISQIRQLGVHLSIDDYGTGYSTLEYIQKIQATELKLDRSFVCRMDENSTDRLLVKATIDLAHSLGIKIVAEGVESAAHLEMLKSLGCDYAQGYYLGKPKNINDTQKLIVQGKTQVAA